jgi:flagellar biosynthetic protein FlhB
MSEERTEAPTPKRREEVRKKGQTSRSQELTSAAVFLAGLYALKFLAVTFFTQIGALLVGNILAVGTIDTTGTPEMGGSVTGAFNAIMIPFLGVLAVAAVGVSLAQGGFLFAPKLAMPRFDRVNPMTGTKRILSMQGLMATGKTIAKFIAVGLTVTVVIRGHLQELATIGEVDLVPGLRLLMDLIWDVLFKSALAMLLIGLADFLWERRRFLQSLRMTKQEVKEEYRQSEGDPRVRGQFRRRREAFHQQMMEAVRTADVVITNPTHFAVALKYDPESMMAPEVVAKGQDLLALRIREAASEARVPIMENPPLARALYKLVPIGSPIPAELYVAVAEVLAFIFRLRAEREAAG